MSKETRQANTAIADITNRSADLTDEYTAQLEQFVNDMLPTFLQNDEYAARCSAMMIAINRNLARCAATFGEVHQVSEEEMLKLVMTQFTNNYSRCLAALRGDGVGQTVQ